MSTTKIQNVKYFNDKSLSFKYVLKTHSNQNSPHFYMDSEGKDTCFLKTNWTSAGTGYTSNFTLSLHFNKREAEYNYEEFEIIVWLNNSIKGHAFKLQKTIEMGLYSHSSDSYTIAETITSSQTGTPIYVKISYKTKYDTIDSELNDSFKDLLHSEEYSDLKLKIENKTFNVHKCIISSRCNVLKKMIDTDMIEKKTGMIELSGWDILAVTEVLAYIYTNKCDVAKVPHELFQIAHFLELKELELKCNQHLLKNVNLKNIISTLMLVDMEQYELYQLKEIANNFVSQNEDTLVQDLDFLEHLVKNIQTSNIQFILKIAKKHKLNEILDCAMKFLTQNYKECLKNEECKKFFTSEPNLMLNIYEYSCNFYSAQIEKMKNNNEESE